MKGSLYLIPSTLGDTPVDDVIPTKTIEITRQIRHFVVEDTRSARRFLSRLGVDVPIDQLEFVELNEHTPSEEVLAMLEPALNGHSIGIISEAGVPSVADPGAPLVALAHQKGIKVIPLVGPSSILLALMASGFNGQAFSFNGYLPIKPEERIRAIKQLEKQAQQSGQTQLFMETPYRNNKLISDLLEHCHPSTLLCLAVDITLPSEWIKTQSIATWRKQKPDIHKRACIFIIQ